MANLGEATDCSIAATPIAGLPAHWQKVMEEPISAVYITRRFEMTRERAVLAGGCFWGMQDLIRKLPGVASTRVGYTGGSVANATYRNHEGHAEALEINFDPAKTSFRDLLEFFFQIHDPSTLNRLSMPREFSSKVPK